MADKCIALTFKLVVVAEVYRLLKTIHILFLVKDEFSWMQCEN